MYKNYKINKCLQGKASKGTFKTFVCPQFSQQINVTQV